MLLKCFIVVTIGITFVYGECGKCPDIPKHYEELKCKPIKENKDDCCPSRYECPDIVALDKSKCHFEGKTYDVGNELKAELPTCTASCSCAGEGQEVGFSCVFSECPEALEPPKPDCAHQFTIDSCCTTKTICDPDEIKNLPRCYNDGKEFVRGNLIYPKKSPCYKCLCDDKFDNKTDVASSPSCKRVNCGIELHQFSYLQQGGVPVYFNDHFCCPFEFRTPNEKDILVPAKEKPANTSPENSCKYGKLTMAVGDSIKTEDPCLECSCSTPPLAQCVRTINTEKCH